MRFPHIKETWVKAFMYYTVIKLYASQRYEETHNYNLSYTDLIMKLVQTASPNTFSGISRLFLVLLESMDRNKKRFLHFGSKPHLKVQMHLSLDNLVAKVRFQSVFCITRNVTLDFNVRSRVTDVHRAGADSILLLAESYGGQHREQQSVDRC